MELQSAISRRRRPARRRRLTWAYVTLKMIFSNDPRQKREGLRANPWALPIIEQMRGLRTLRGPYLGSSWLPPKGSLRARTRDFYPSGIHQPRPTILFAPNVVVPGAVQGLGFSFPERLIFGLRVWFRRTQKNAILRRAAAERHQRGVFRRDFDFGVSLRQG